MVYYLFAVSGVRSASPPDSHHQTFIFSVNDNMTTDNMMLKSTIMEPQYCELPPCPRLAGGNNLPSNTTRVSTVTEPGRTLENYPPPLRIRSVAPYYRLEYTYHLCTMGVESKIPSVLHLISA